MRADACPDRILLELFLQGRVARIDAEPLERHVQACPLCSKLLPQLDRLDQLLETARTLGKPTADTEPAVVEGLIKQLTSLAVETPATGPAILAGSAEAVDFSLLLEPAQGKAELGRLGHYSVLEFIGAGGMGVVFRAEDTRLGRLVALKVIKPRLAEKTSARQRFLREARVAARLRHPAIVPLYEVGGEGGPAYLAYALIEGSTLADWLASNKPTPRQAAEWTARLADALECAHTAGIVHRDVKPANVMLDEAGQPTLADFGVALQTDALAEVTQEGDIIGTPAYMSPEQAAGRRREIGPLSDVYSLGALLYQLVCGCPPFQGSLTSILHQVANKEPAAPRLLISGIPRDLETICQKAMSKEPLRRYASAGAMADDLRRYLQHLPIHARRPSLAGRFALWCRRKPAIAASIAIATAVCVFFGLASFYRVVAERDQARQQAATYALERGISLCESGDPGQGILWMVRGLELAPPNAEHIGLAIRANLGAWQTEVPRHHSFKLGNELLADFSASSDGRIGATVSKDGKVQVWELAAGTPLGREIQVNGRVISLSQSGRYLLTAGVRKDQAGPVAWRIEPGGPKLVHDLSESDIKHLASIQFSPDERFAASGGFSDGLVQIWNLESGKSVGKPFHHGSGYVALVFSADGRTLITGGNDGSVRMWDVVTQRQQGTALDHGSPVQSLANCPRDNLIATTTLDSKAYLWSGGSGKLLHPPFETTFGVGEVQFSADGRILACTGIDRLVRLWDVATGKLACSVLPHTVAVTGMSFTGSRSLMTGCEDGTVHRWDIPNSKQASLVFEHKSKVWTAAFTPDGKHVLTGCGQQLRSGSGYAQLWDVNTGAAVQAPVLHKGSVFAVAVSPDGKSYFTGDGEGKARFWLETSNGFEKKRELAMPFTTHGPPPIAAAAFSPDGRSLVLSTMGPEFPFGMVFDVTTGKRIDPPLLHDKLVRTAVFSRDGKLIVTGSYDRTARLWDSATHRQIGESMRMKGDVGAVGISSDGQLTLVGDDARYAQFWETATSRPVGVPLRHQGTVRSVAFSPDGRLVATGSWDKTARFWEPMTGMPIGPPLTHNGEVEFAGFSPDGKQLLTASWDKTARLWEVPTPMEGTVQAIAQWANALTGMELDANGVASVLGR